MEEEDVGRWARRRVLTHRSRGGLWILFSVYAGATDLIVKISAAVGVIRARGWEAGMSHVFPDHTHLNMIRLSPRRAVQS